MVSRRHFRRILRTTSRALIPLHAVYEVTHRCNLSCVHCYQARKAPGEELLMDEFKALVREMREGGTMFLAFSGGEPLLG